MLKERLQVNGVPSEPVQGSRKELVVVYLIHQMVPPPSPVFVSIFYLLYLPFDPR